MPKDESLQAIAPVFAITFYCSSSCLLPWS